MKLNDADWEKGENRRQENQDSVARAEYNFEGMSFT
jgi:hypothetical protein